MGEKDIAEKNLIAYNDVFADIINALLFDGEQLVQPDNLTDVLPKSQYKADDSKLHEIERDCTKKWNDSHIGLSVLGIENQERIEHVMPLRVIAYDRTNYRSQLLGDSTEHYPVISVVLNFSNKRWNAATKLSQCFNVHEKLKPYFHDYGINVFDIAFLSEEQVSKFRSDFRIVAEFLVNRRVNREYIPSDQIIRHVDEILKLFSVITSDGSWLEVMKENNTHERKVARMCEMIEHWEARGEAKGKAEALISIINILRRQGKSDEEIRAELLFEGSNFSEDMIDSILYNPITH